MREFGDISGIVFNVRSGNLVGGNQRGRNLDETSKVVITKRFDKPTRTGTIAVGYILHDNERFSYREVDWDIDRETAAMLAANKNAGVWDTEVLTEHLKHLGSFDVDFDMELTMFEDDELADFGVHTHTVSEHERTNPTTGVDEDEVPEKAPAITRLGDLYQLGNHRVMCGDSTSKTDLARLIDQDIDFVFTSPPYNVGLDYNSHDDSMSKDNYEKLLSNVMVRINEVAAKDFAVCWNKGASMHPCDYRMDLALLQKVWGVKRTLVWKKKGITGPPLFAHTQKNPVTKNYLPFFGWEFIFICTRGGKGTVKIPEDVLDRRMTDVWEVDQSVNSSDQGKRPGAFPVQLVSDAIYLFADKTVYEPFCGSGSTIIACEKTGRRGYGMEIDPVYCDIIVARWEKYTGLKAKLLSRAVKTKKKTAA